MRIQVFWKGVVGFLRDDHAYKRNHFSRTNKQFFLINLIDQGCHMQLSIVFHINNIDFPCPFSLRTLLLLLVIVFFISGEQRSIEKSSRILLYKSSIQIRKGRVQPPQPYLDPLLSGWLIVWPVAALLHQLVDCSRDQEKMDFRFQ